MKTLSLTVFRATDPLVTGYTDGIAMVSANATNARVFDYGQAQVGSFRDEGYATLWSYTVPAETEAELDSLQFQASPGGQWDHPLNGSPHNPTPRGRARLRVDGNAIDDVQLNSRCASPGLGQSNANDAWDSTTLGTAREYPVLGDGVDLSAGQVVSVLFDPGPTQYGQFNNGNWPSVVRTSLWGVDPTTGRYVAARGRYAPPDLVAGHTAFSWTVPAGGFRLKGWHVQADGGTPIVVFRPTLFVNDAVVHQFATFYAGNHRGAFETMSVPLGFTLRTGDTISLRGNPQVDTGGSVSVHLLGTLTDLTQFAPELIDVTPAPGTAISPGDTISFAVHDVDGDLASVTSVTVHYIDATSEVAYSGGVFGAAFNAASSVAPNGDDLEFDLIRDDGYTQTVSKIVVVAVDGAGHSATISVGSWIVAASGPEVTSVTPTEGTLISASTEIAFTVTDPDGDLDEVTSVTAYFLDGSSAVVWSGGPAFGAGYNAGSSVVPNGDDLDFTIVRDDGWVQTLSRLVVTAVDGAGNTTTETLGSWIVIAAEPEPPEPPALIETPVTFGDPEYRDVVATALSRLPSQYRGDE